MCDENLLIRWFGSDLALEEKEVGDSTQRFCIFPKESPPKVVEVRKKIMPRALAEERHSSCHIIQSVVFGGHSK